MTTIPWYSPKDILLVSIISPSSVSSFAELGVRSFTFASELTPPGPEAKFRVIVLLLKLAATR